MPQIFDAYGIEIKIDSVIAMAFTKHSSAEIRIGKVIEFVESQPDYGSPVHKIRVRWRPKPNGYGHVEKSVISVWSNCVVIE